MSRWGSSSKRRTTCTWPLPLAKCKTATPACKEVRRLCWNKNKRLLTTDLVLRIYFKSIGLHFVLHKYLSAQKCIHNSCGSIHRSHFHGGPPRLLTCQFYETKNKQFADLITQGGVRCRFSQQCLHNLQVPSMTCVM